jgi:putative lipoic acid-binding regulatory protein
MSMTPSEIITEAVRAWKGVDIGDHTEILDALDQAKGQATGEQVQLIAQAREQVEAVELDFTSCTECDNGCAENADECEECQGAGDVDDIEGFRVEVTEIVDRLLEDLAK